MSSEAILLLWDKSNLCWSTFLLPRRSKFVERHQSKACGFAVQASFIVTAISVYVQPVTLDVHLFPACTSGVACDSAAN